MASVGHVLINEILPPAYRIAGPVTASSLHASMARLAKENNALYVETITKLKRRGDEVTTLEGISVGIADIKPEYAKRDALMGIAEKDFRAAKNDTDRVKVIVGIQDKMMELTTKHPSSMTQMATSGARGSVSQLMKIVATPIASQASGKVAPWLFTKSYSEGLSPADYWVTGPEARANNIATTVSTSEPGEMAKLLVANLAHHVVTSRDCGTHAGVRMAIDDPHLIDRHLAGDQHGHHHNELVTPRLVAALKAKKGMEWLLVRSPMTCSSHPGTCQMCWGLDEKGNLHNVGINVGTRAAQAMAEPLTQMALLSKHAVISIKEKSLVPTGFKGVRQILEIPSIFQGEAVIAPKNAVVERIVTAPQGGYYINLSGIKKELYVSPQLSVTVKVGDHVEAGDALTNGMPRPDMITRHKGIGAGRQYFVDTMAKSYGGINLDKRHFELLSKALLNHVRFVDHDPNHPEFIKGDVVAYNTLVDTYGKESEDLPLEKAEGRLLAKEIHHYTVGTLVTPSLVKDLRSHGVRNVAVAKHMPHVEPIHKSFVMSPLMEHDWMGRLSHRYLRGTIEEAAHTGLVSDVHGYNPATAYAYGAEFGEGPSGRY